MSTRTIMQSTNNAIKKKMIEEGYIINYVAPHSRFSKDIVIDGEGFDAITTRENFIYLCQWKTHVRPSKKILEKYKQLEEKYGVRCIWCNKEHKTTTSKKGEVVIYVTTMKTTTEKCINCNADYRRYIQKRTSRHTADGIRSCNSKTCSQKCSREWERTLGRKKVKQPTLEHMGLDD